MIVPRILVRVARGVRFLAFFLVELGVSNAVVAWEVATPRHFMRPGIVRVPVRSRSNLEVTLLANLVSLTPGTLSLEVTEDRSALFIHALHLVSPDHLRIRVRRLEDRLLAVLR
jgi:multicomponent Na+:H+ antiporter subunit E